MNLLTRNQVAKLFQVSEKHIEHQVRAGRLSVVKVGRSTRFEPSEVEAYISRNRLTRIQPTP